jgi:DNA-binding response OmpR family regulator
MAKTEKPDLIFLGDSLSLPDGEEVCRELKQNSDLKDVPVVMILSGDQKELEPDLRRTGADGFITRPFDPSEIVGRVRGLFEKDETPPAGEEPKADKDLPSGKDDRPDEREIRETAPEKGEMKSEDALNIVDTSDLVDGPDPSSPATDEEVAHGFDWFLHELRKEAQEDEKADSHVDEKLSPSEDKISVEGAESKKETQIYEIGEHEKGYEEFLRDLKLDLEEPDKKEAPRAGPSAAGAIGRSRFDQLLSDLKDKISERVAQELTKKITPEFLERIIREEMTKLAKESS